MVMATIFLGFIKMKPLLVLEKIGFGQGNSEIFNGHKARSRGFDDSA